jgi:hypothetical protein
MAQALTPTFRHSPDMGEISGFGGGYEECCQDMLEAGVRWLQEHPQPKLEGQTLKNVYGIFDATSDDAKALEAAVLEGAKGEATGAMHHAVMSRLFWIAKHGWDEYCAELRHREAEA